MHGGARTGAACLLKGYRATTHWSSVDLLAPFGAVYCKQRIVFDRNRVTAAGVTSCIDMALALAAKLWGKEAAQMIALNMKYEPDRLSPPAARKRPRKLYCAPCGRKTQRGKKNGPPPCCARRRA
jgi:cyclohexyl-isocyanide hydratase